VITPAPLAQTQTGRAYRRASRRPSYAVAPSLQGGATDPTRINHDADARRLARGTIIWRVRAPRADQARDGNRRPDAAQTPVSGSHIAGTPRWTRILERTRIRISNRRSEKAHDRVIRTDKLTKFYGSHRGIVEVDVDVQKGEVFGFLGPNGAGKTTTIRLLLDLIRPTAARPLSSTSSLRPIRRRSTDGSATCPASSRSTID